MRSEHVGTYYYDMRSEHGVFDIFSCYSSNADYYSRNVSFYHVYDKTGTCLNEGNPFYQFPTWEEVYERYYLTHVM
ncbi:MAG: hypothetical protein EBU90_30625 [Proteobacteria bacterium]|nr:hypothetical protein [Pseudomonadota bacterium]